MSPPRSSWKTGVYEKMESVSLVTELLEDQPIKGTSPSILKRSRRVKRPNPKYANVVVVEEDKEPMTFQEVSKKAKWRLAMKEEMKALVKNQSWDLIPKPKDVKPISCKWLYKIKTRPDGSIERYKARLVARDFSQQYGLDYDETFIPWQR